MIITYENFIQKLIEGLSLSSIRLDRKPGLSSKDISDLTRLYWEGFCMREPFWELEARTPIEEEMESLATDPRGLIITALMDNETVGMVLAGSFPSKQFTQFPNGRAVVREAREDVYIFEVAVSPNSRGIGIGKRLMKATQETAIQSANTGTALKTDFRNTAMISLCQKLGFKILAFEPSEDPFSIYLQSPLSSSANQPSPISSKIMTELLELYPLSEFLFFSNRTEISGWQKTTGSQQTPTGLYYDETNSWSKSESPEKTKAAYVISR